MKYISLMGTQTMAVLNPLLALMEQGKAVEKVHILATRKTMERAEILRNFLVPAKLAPDRFEIIPVSDSLHKDREEREPGQKIVSDLLSDDTVLNMAGGMNFQIAACIQAIGPQKCLFLYPESSGIHAFAIAEGKILSREILPLPAPIDADDVMNLQGIPFEKESSKEGAKIHPFLKRIFGICGLPVPKGAQKNIRIRNVLFDLVWNSGNELKFIKVIHTETKKQAEKNLQEVRNVITLARNREHFGELYHRDVAIVTNHKLIDERIPVEGGGKTESLFYFESSGVLGEKLLHAELKKGLIKFLNPPVSGTLPKEVISAETGNSESGDTVLYTSLGTNIMPSLIALWSHKPAAVCFVYTPDVPEIVKFRDAMLREKKMLPVNAVSFYPVSIEGTEIMDMPKSETGQGIVNISPGTKGHTAFLTLWAGMHGMPMFSLKTSGTYEQIPQGQSGSITAPPPVTFLKLTDIDVQQFGEGKESILQKQLQHETILDFLRMMDRENKAVSDFYRNRIEMENAGLEFLAGEKVRIWQKGKKDLVFSAKGDEWFEALTGFVMLQCGAQDVQVRVRTRWSRETEKYLSEKYKAAPHMTDIDVIARFNTDYYVISCKAAKKDAPGKITAEADAFASLFGRFAIPLVCYLKYEGQPYNSSNGVYIFGYRTLCDTEAMKALLKLAVTEKRKTGRE